MGNGPSLLKADLDAFASDVTIASNAHFLIWDQISYVPTVLTVEDRLVAEDRAGELSALSGTTAIFPFEFRDLLGQAEPDRIYVNFVRVYAPWPQFTTRFAQRVFWGGTVSFMNLQLANYMQCSPIYLVGFDHSYAASGQRESEHVIRSDTADVNHIHPDYFGPGFRWHDPNLTRMELGYRCARAYLDGRGVPVRNATHGGQLEIFERVPPTSIEQQR